MAAVNPLLILTVAMIGFLFAVTVGILTFRNWKSYRPTLTGAPDESMVSNAMSSPLMWALGFVGITIVLGLLAGLWVAGPAAMQGTLSLGVLAVLGILLAFLVFTGIWDAIKGRGRSNSEAVGVGAIILGLLFVLVIAAQLVLGG